MRSIRHVARGVNAPCLLFAIVGLLVCHTGWTATGAADAAGASSSLDREKELDSTMSKSPIDFAKFYAYDELCSHIRDLVARHPELASVRTIGTSPEGRDLLLVEITNPETGPASEKPVFLVHGNIHAGEVSGSTCALYLIHRLLNAPKDDAQTQRLLDTIAFHIVPRVCPDGAEEILTQDRQVRSRRTFEKVKNCIWPEDLNGDGRIHQMRIADPNGSLFAPDDEPRLLVPRSPGDEGGTRYRVTTEGMIHDWDGGPWDGPALDHYDFNRNWAANWLPQHQQAGAGNYPFSEPEVRALADHVLATPTIFGMFGLHNGTNAILRPPTSGGDGAINNNDILAFRRLAAVGADMTGFPAKAIHEYRNVMAQPISLHGTFTEWGYYHCGLFAMEIELGNLYNGVGYTTEELFAMTPEKDRERDRKCLEWHDAHPSDQVFADWQPFDHPQLGPVEIGGIRPEGLYNVVPEQRIDVWQKTCRFTLALAERGPRLELSNVASEAMGGGLYRVRCRVANEGYLPTHVTSLGAGLGHMEAVQVEVDREGDVEFVAGRNRVDIGHLGASAYQDLEWIVKPGDGASIRITAHAARAGVAHAAVTF